MSGEKHTLTRRAIDNTGHRFRKYKELPGDLSIIQSFRQLRCTGLEDLFKELADVISGFQCVLSCRVKRTDTIIRKLRREHSMDLSRMDDIIGFRIIVPSLSVQHDLVNCIMGHFKGRVRDYTIEPTPGGYRANHITIKQNIVSSSGLSYDFPYEIQVRTYYQHIWSTTSESFGEQVKEGGGTKDERDYLLELSNMTQTYENNFPEYNQIEGLSMKVNIVFVIKVFDKKTGNTILNENLGSDLKSAISRMRYLEDTYRADFSRETVLLGLPTGDDEAKYTHMRYFHYAGIPDIPENIRPSIARPAI